ncbi:MAG TPA: capsule assembly Wzi family protein [Terriglobales bacterium]
MFSFRSFGLGIAMGAAMQLSLWAQQSSVETAAATSSGAVQPAPAPSQPGEDVKKLKLPTTLENPKPVDSTEDSLLGEDPDNRLIVPFAKHLVSDQRAFWTAPAHFKVNDLQWIAPFAGITAGFIAGDSWISKQIPTSKIQTSKTFSDYGVYSLIGAGGGAFVLGHLTGNDHMSEAGLLSGEAAINSTAIAMLFKGITQRPRPYQANGNGTFFQGGSSFPSEHAAIAWSVASVMAHEYPGPLTKILAYGLATGISATRVTGQQHFASDVIIGSALGWYFGRQVYRAHHNSDLGGDAWGDLVPERSGEQTRNPENMGSPYVPLDSWVYPALERLIALGYVQSGYLGIRPWTRMACAQMLEEAQQKIADEDDPDGVAAHIYRDLAKEFSAEGARLDGARNLGANIDSIYARVTNISGPPLRDGYHFGQTIVNDYGRPFGAGTSSIAGVSGWATAGPLAIYVRGEYQQAPSVASMTPSQLQAMSQVDLLPAGTNFSVNTGTVNRFQLLEGSVNLNFRNVQFSFGKQNAWLGPGESGSFLFSDNAAPITMFKMDSIEPFEFPLLSKFLGPARIEFFLGRLSGHEWINSPPTLYGPYSSDQPFIHGNKISFMPTQNLEFGADFTAMFAGAGVPFTFREFFRTYYAHTANLAQNPGKRFSAFDFRYRVPGLRDWLTVYGDSLVVDEYSPITSGRASVNPGIYMPKFPGISRLQLRAEGINESRTTEFSPGFVYIDGRYLSGYTSDGTLLGNWIGRAGRGGQGWATYSFSPRTSLQFSYRAQRVSPRFLEGGSLNDFSMKWDQYLHGGVGLSATVQYENWRFPLLATGRQTNVMSSVQLTYWPKLGRQER